MHKSVCACCNLKSIFITAALLGSNICMLTTALVDGAMKRFLSSSAASSSGRAEPPSSSSSAEQPAISLHSAEQPAEQLATSPRSAEQPAIPLEAFIHSGCSALAGRGTHRELQQRRRAAYPWIFIMSIKTHDHDWVGSPGPNITTHD